VEVCGASSGLDVPTGDGGHLGVTRQSGGPNTGVPLRDNIYKTACICKKGLSYLFSISTLMSFGLFQSPSSDKSIIVTLEYTLLRHVKLLDRLSDPHGPLINWISSGTSSGTSTGPEDNCFICVCVHGFPICIPFARREKHKRASTASEEAAAEEKPPLTLFEWNFLHSYTQKA